MKVTAHAQKQPSIRRAWGKVLHNIWRSLIRVDRSQLTFATALRSSLGVFIPLLLGVVTGHLIEGVSMAGGAATIGSVGLTYTYRARVRTMLFACLAIALSAFVGGLIGTNDLLTVLVIGLWGFGSGMLVALSPAATIVGLQASLALILLTHFKLSPLLALIQAGLMLLGALFQITLALLPSFWFRFGPESAVISTVYQSLADFVLEPEDGSISRQLSAALLKAETTVSDSRPESRKGRVLSSLLAEAEHIRLELMILAEVRQCLLSSESSDHALEETLSSQMQAIAEILRGIAERCKRVRILPDTTQAYQQIDEAISRLRGQDSFACARTSPRQIAVYYAALCRHLRHAEEMAHFWQQTRRHMIYPLDKPRRPRLQLYDPLATLRSNLSLSSTAFRHALRLGVALLLAAILYRFSPLGRGYWIPLTTLLVLKPDFSTTFNNSLLRALGTMLGAILTTLLIFWLHPHPALLAVMISIAVFLAYSLLNVNYALFSLFITTETVLLLTLVDPQTGLVVFDRALDTAIGTALALLTYAFWPSWERSHVSEKLAVRIEKLQHYFMTIMQTFIDPVQFKPEVIEQRRSASRLARSNAEASVDRMLNEPVRYQGDPDIARGLLAATDGLAKGILALEAQRLESKNVRPEPGLKKFTDEVCEALEALSNVVRKGEYYEEPRKLTLRSLEQSKKAAEARGEDVTEFNLLLLHGGQIVNSINVMNRLLSAHSGATGKLGAVTASHA